MKILKAIKEYLHDLRYRYWYCLDSESFINYCRRRGIKIGHGTEAPHPETVDMDWSRPQLIEIGNYVRLNKDLTIMSHDYAGMVAIHRDGEFINSSGKIKIGNNVYFGRQCTVLKGVTIGDNCIIGFGSVVMKDIPANSVAVGRPAKVICTLDEYLDRRKQKMFDEAAEYARAIAEKEGRRPTAADFWEEFHLFMDGDNMSLYPEVPLRRQLCERYDYWVKNHKRTFDGLDEFLKAAGVDDIIPKS